VRAAGHVVSISRRPHLRAFISADFAVVTVGIRLVDGCGGSVDCRSSVRGGAPLQQLGPVHDNRDRQLRQHFSATSRFNRVSRAWYTSPHAARTKRRDDLVRTETGIGTDGHGGNRGEF
jgi:hypothetical protein